MPIDGDIILKAGLDTKGITSSINNLQKTISRGLKNAIRIGFGVRSVYALIRKLRTAMFEGFGELAQVHEPFNQAMSEIKTSLLLLRNTFASAFAPIIETVAPILSTFINMVANAVSVVGQFIAALTGKEYVRAGTVQVDYASSVDKSTKSTDRATSATKKQTKAQKELNREITHFDDLVILHEKHEDDTDTDYTPSVTSPSAFSTMPIGEAVSKFAKDFKAAWDNADFTDLGRKVGEKLRDALNSIEWDTQVKPMLRKIASSIATFLNGFLETPGLFSTIGRTLAQALNSAFEFVNEFVTKFHWSSLGRAIKDLILSAVNSVDWALLYDTAAKLGAGIGTAIQTGLNDERIWTALTTLFNHRIGLLLTALDNFITSIEWSDFGRNIAIGLNNGVATFPWDLLATTLIHAVNGAINLLYNFVTTFDFYKFGVHIGSTLSKTINGIDWKTGGASIGEAINGLFQALNGFIASVPWSALGIHVRILIRSALGSIKWDQVYSVMSKFGTKLAEFLNSLLDENTFKEVGESAAKLLNSAFAFINRFGSTFDFTKFGTSLAAGINGFLLTFDANRLTAGVNKLVKGLRDSVVAFISNVSWYELGTKLREILVSLDWGQILYSFGRVFWEAINAGITGLKGLFKEDNVYGPIKTALDELEEVITKLAGKVDFDAISSGFEKIVTALKPAGEGFAVGLVKAFQSLAEIGLNFLIFLGAALTSIATAVEKFDPDLLFGIGVALGVFTGALLAIKGAETVASIVNKMVAPFSSLLGVLSSHPLLSIAAGLGALGLAAGQLVDRGFFSDEDTKLAIQNANSVIDSAKLVQENVQAALDTIEGKDRDISVTYKTIQNLADEYFNLKQKVYLTKEEQKKLQELEATLSEQLPGFQQIVADTTTNYSDQQTAVNELITSTEQYYKTLAAEDFLKDYYQKMFDLEVEIQKNRDAHHDLAEAYDNTIDRSTLLGGLAGTLYDAFDGTRAKLSDLDAEYMNLREQQDALNASYEAQRKVVADYGVTVEDTSTKVSGLVETGETVKESTDKVKESTSEATTSTSDFAKIFDAFADISISTPLKLAIISAAIKSLSDNGKLSKDETAELYGVLDKYNPRKPKESMKAVADAFDKTSVSSSDFRAVLVQNYNSVDKETKNAMLDIAKHIGDAGSQFKAKGDSSGQQIINGLMSGIDAKTSDLETLMENLGTDSVSGTFKSAMDMNSPSKVMEGHGENIIQGLANGISSKIQDVTQIMSNLAQDIISKIRDLLREFETVGNSLLDAIGSGLSDDQKLYSLKDSMATVMTEIYNRAMATSFYDVGTHIADGIYNGLSDNSNYLSTLAWNTAVNMYNSACRALGIYSPSRKFAWIGRMVTEGLGKGILTTEDNAVDAVTDLTDSMTQEAEKANPAINIETSITSWIDALDNVLTDFCDTIVTRFESMVNALINIGSANVGIPPIAQGRVIPSSIQTNAAVDNASNMMEMLESLAFNQMTAEELRPLLIEMFSQYMNLSWNIGDEQLARHVNNGNLLLDRRYSIIK